MPISWHISFQKTSKYDICTDLQNKALPFYFPAWALPSGITCWCRNREILGLKILKLVLKWVDFSSCNVNFYLPNYQKIKQKNDMTSASSVVGPVKEYWNDSFYLNFHPNTDSPRKVSVICPVDSLPCDRNSFSVSSCLPVCRCSVVLLSVFTQVASSLWV